MAGRKTYFGSGNSLRQKAVNLFYLIFLILIFSFIPSDFVDSAHYTNSSLDLISNDINQLNKTSRNYFLHLLQSEPILYEETRDKFIEIENITKNTTTFIDELKLQLINVDKINEYGFFKNGRRESTSQELMVYGNKADSLFNKLEAFKLTISEYLSPREVEEIHKILPLPKYELTSQGNYIEADKFYFNRTPLNVAILNLSHFKSRVERIQVYVNQKLIRSVLFENAAVIPEEYIKIFTGETAINQFDSEDKFFERLDSISLINNGIDGTSFLKNRYFIESITDTIHPLGKALKYYVHFDNLSSQNLKITVSSDDGTQYFGLSKPGSFYFFPSSRGRYTITFNNGTKVQTKVVTVIDANPILQNTKLSTLYIGLDNPLNVKTSEFDANDNLIAEITDGQIIKKGDIFYARVFKKGITRIKIFAHMPYGKIKVAEKSFVIRELHAPTPIINGLKSGGNVRKISLRQFEHISLKTDEYLIKEDVYVADFDFTLIYNNYGSVNRPIKNKGASFNGRILRSLNRAQKGDVLIFSNIRTLSSRGIEVIIPSLTLTVI